MPGRSDFSADLILICNSLDAGGIERVVSTLANEWSRRGRKVCVVTMHDRCRFYALEPAIHHVVIDRAGLARLADLLRWLAAHLRGSAPPRFWLLRVLGGVLHRLFIPRLYRAYAALVYAYETWALRRVLKRIESPIVVSLGTPTNIVAVRACRGLGRRLVISERNDPQRLPRIRNWDALARKL